MKRQAVNIYKRAACLLIILAIIVFFAGCGYKNKSHDAENSSKKTEVAVEANEERALSKLEENDITYPEDTDYHSREDGVLNFHMLDVKQGLCVIVNYKDHWMMYDGGPAGTSSYVVSYLKKQEVKRLDYLVVSHYDADHISGLVGVLNVFECNTVLCPSYEADSEIYESFMSMLEKNGAEKIHPEQGNILSFGDAEVQLVGPYTYSYTEENDRSICVRIVFGNTSFLICGDAGSQAESDMISVGVPIQSDIFVANHHGSGYSNTVDFLERINPKYVLVSCALGNVYGHPALNTMEEIKKLGCDIYRTDLQGTIVLRSDGNEIWSDSEVCVDWRSGEELLEDSKQINVAGTSTENQNIQALEKNECQYVCNTNTMKFHYDYCNSVKQMSEKNKKYTNESRESLINQGYQSCGNCKP